MGYACEAHGHLGPTLAPHSHPSSGHPIIFWNPLASTTTDTKVLSRLLPLNYYSLPTTLPLHLTKASTSSTQPQRYLLQSAPSYSLTSFSSSSCSSSSCTVHIPLHANPEEALHTTAFLFVLLSAATALCPLAWVDH